MADLMEKITALCKRRGFIYPGSEIYGGLTGFWDYGPLGVELKNNVKAAWWRAVVHNREDMVGLWGTIADQVKDQGLLLGTQASSPPTRPDGVPE